MPLDDLLSLQCEVTQCDGELSMLIEGGLLIDRLAHAITVRLKEDIVGRGLALSSGFQQGRERIARFLLVRLGDLPVLEGGIQSTGEKDRPIGIAEVLLGVAEPEFYAEFLAHEVTG